MSEISARVIADSINTAGNRLTSLVIVLPRIVLAEFNTHRAISKNSASSRAIPFKKMLDQVLNTPFVPLKFLKEHTGMQGTIYFTGDTDGAMRAEWLHARDTAMIQAKSLSQMGVTKQLCNRLLEPFLYHTIIATATEWQNFIALRAHNQAEIHIQDAAFKILEALNESKPKLLEEGQWHIPFGDNLDNEKLRDASYFSIFTDEDRDALAIKVATARCARVSYMNFEGKDDYSADIKLHDMLLSSGHMSPFEHCAQAAPETMSGNLQGFSQYRKKFSVENKTDKRLINYKNLNV